MSGNKQSTKPDRAQPEQPAPKPTASENREESTAESAEKAVDIEALWQELEEQKELVKHHLDQWKRAAADLENYKKRVQKERDDLVKFGNAVLIGKLLPALDDFERAFRTLPAEFNGLTWSQGVGLIHHKLQLALEQHGLKEIDALGKPFDPLQHEAVLHEENDAYPDGHIVAVLQKGYMLHDRVLRAAMVKVAKNKGSDGTKPPTEEGKSEEA